MKKSVVLGVIGADCHAVANKVLDYAFSEAGFEVHNIGVLCSQEEFVEAAARHQADAILVSSLYGHGEMDCRGLREKCKEAGMEDILLYAGGNLVVGKQEFVSVQDRFIKMGFDRVYAPGTSPEKGIEDLNHDLQERKTVTSKAS